MAKETVERFGAIDTLLNNAAVFYDLRRIPWDMWTIDEWEKIWMVNVIGTWLCVKSCAPHMVIKNRGKIINITSAVLYTGQALMLPYSCS